MHEWKFTVVLYGRGDSHGDAWQDAVMNFADQTDGPSISDDLGEQDMKEYSYTCFEDALEFAEGLGWSVTNPDKREGDDLEGDALGYIMKSGYVVVYPAAD